MLTEKQFSQQVVDLAKIYGWEVYRTWNSIHSPAGYPDLSLCKPPRLIFAELKTDKGKVTEAQEKWLDLLGRCQTIEVYLWRPNDFDFINQRLTVRIKE